MRLLPACVLVIAAAQRRARPALRECAAMGRRLRPAPSVSLAPIPRSMRSSILMYLTAARKMMRYAVNADGTLGESSVFAEGDGIGDGIKVDTKGNVFSASGGGRGVIRITSPQGKFLGSLNLPIYGGEPKKQICATNQAFGGPDGRTLFITACDAVYKIRMKTTGLLPGPMRTGSLGGFPMHAMSTSDDTCNTVCLKWAMRGFP